MKTAVFYLLTIVLVLWVQMAGDYFVGASGFSGNTVLVVVLYFGLSRGPMTGEMLGLLWGLLIDASSLGLLGLHALLYAGAGYLAGMLRRQLDEKKAWTQAIFSIGVSLLYVLVYFIADRIFSFGPHPVSWPMIAQPLINGAMAPLFFWFMQQWSQLWDMLPQER